eukprot:4713817-Alexandrium_andersonii.AAC.1
MAGARFATTWPDWGWAHRLVLTLRAWLQPPLECFPDATSQLDFRCPVWSSGRTVCSTLRRLR